VDAASCIYNFFFGAERDYYRDQDLHQAGQKSSTKKSERHIFAKWSIGATA
jgi:hypothetical protein